MKFKYLLIVVFIAFFALFTFWPSLIAAHYDGSVSCPLISMSDSFGCQNMSNHLNNLIAHISDFSSMISAILVGGFFSLFIICAIKLFKKLHFARTNNFYIKKNKINQFIQHRDKLSSSIRITYLLFSGLRRGVLNTKSF